jgi:ANTAR domain
MVPTATNGIDEREAFDLLRSHSRRTGRKLIDLAEAVSTSHLLLPRQPALGSKNSQSWC